MSSNEKSKIKLIVFLVLIGFTLFFLFQFFTNLEYGSLKESTVSFKIGIAILAFIIYLLMNYVRTLRLYNLFDKKISVLKLYALNANYNLLNHTLPYRLGEISLPLIMNREDEKEFPLNKSFGGLIYIRIFDVIISSILLFIVTLIYYNDLYHSSVYLAGSLIVLGVSIGLILFLIFVEKVPKWIEKLENRFHNSLITKLLKFSREVAENLIVIKKNFNHFRYLVYTTLIRILQIIITIFVFKMINISLPIHIMVINDLFIAFVELIPLSLIANFGYYEYSYSTLLGLENIELDNYSNYSIAFLRHFYNFIFMFGYYFIGKIIHFSIKPRKKSEIE